MPQKHPPASTTVSELLVLLNGSSAVGFGSFTAALDAWQAMVVLKHIARKQFINRRNIGSPINLEHVIATFPERHLLKIVIPTAVKRARVLSSERVGRRDLAFHPPPRRRGKTAHSIHSYS